MKRLFAALLVTLLISCELIVDVDVPFKTKQLTANSFFNPDSLWSVQLSLNRNILDEAPFGEVNDAQVIISEGDNPIDTLTNVGPGHFRSDRQTPEAGKIYTLSVSTPGHDNLHVASAIPFPSPITGMEVYESSANQSSMLKVKLRDDGAQGNYYELYLELETEYYDFEKKQIAHERNRISLTSKDPAIQNDNDSFSSSILFKDVLFNGREVELTFETSGGGISNHPMITTTLRTLSEDGYNYLRTARLQWSTSGDPFAQPVNVYNNVQNGFGIFAGYSASVYTKTKPKPVISSIDPPSGTAGDHIIITGENFITSQEAHTSVLFAGQQYSANGQILQLTPTRIEVIVPDMAVTGKILILNGRIAISDSDFIVID